MTPKELSEKVWELVDEHCMEMDLEDYVAFLENLKDDANMRRKSSQKDLDNQSN